MLATTDIPRIILLENAVGTDLPTAFRIAYHTHLLCHRGSVRFMLGEKQLTCQSEEFVFWLAEDHSINQLTFSKDFIATILLVEKHFMTGNVPDQNWGIDAVLHARKYPVKQLVDEKDRARILSNFFRLYHQFQDTTHRFYEEALRLMMRLFILEMWHLFANEYERRGRTVQSGTLYERFIHLVESNCSTQREVQFYARELHISPKYLNYVCKQNTGITASDCIKSYTKEQIIVFLQNTNLNISEITDEMNFSSRSFFTRYVKKILGVTPSEYRNRLK